jgi:hypothetical protein
MAEVERVLHRTTVDAYAKQAHFRRSAFILPPVSETTPLFGTLAFGAVWY